jgi:hypothetical protein
MSFSQVGEARLGDQPIFTEAEPAAMSAERLAVAARIRMSLPFMFESTTY